MSKNSAPKTGVGIVERTFEEICKKLFLRFIPQSVKPNHITLFGLLAGLFAAYGFYMANFSRNYLFLAIIGMLIFQICDTLDGTVARSRKQTSTQGYFLDQMTDIFITMTIFITIGFSSYAKLELLIFPAILYPFNMVIILHWINLKNIWPFPRFGPLELYFSTILLTLATFFTDFRPFDIFGYSLGLFDIACVIIVPFSIIESFGSALKLFRELEEK